jgi:hypothetical protein
MARCIASTRPRRVKGGCPGRSRTRGRGFRFRGDDGEDMWQSGGGAGVAVAPSRGLAPTVTVKLGLGGTHRR